MDQEVGAGGLLPTFVTPDDVRAKQVDVSADLTNLMAAAGRGAAANKFNDTMPEWGAWQGVKTRAQSFVDETPSWFHTKAQMDRGESLQRELATWHETFKGLGFDAGPAPAVPSTGLDLGNLFTGMGPALLILVALYLWKK